MSELTTRQLYVILELVVNLDALRGAIARRLLGYFIAFMEPRGLEPLTFQVVNLDALPVELRLHMDILYQDPTYVNTLRFYF